MGKQLGLEMAAGTRGAKGRRAAVAQVKEAFTRPRRNAPGHGGYRVGAGRKPGPRPAVAHAVRPFLEARHPVHVTLRVTREVGRLRRRSAYHAIRRALSTVLGRGDFRV